ncbi:MAG: diaminopimelate epimerase [Desulfobacteraceae bacterium 4572_130]|nr:MAG: diaminopimelate epimerase [Desulfobacteraceae bacterium 4572_130]
MSLNFWDFKNKSVKQGHKFIKMHGLLNDFVVVDARKHKFNPHTSEIIKICDRRKGIGGDQLVIIEPSKNDSYAFIRFFNPDGKEVKACGNATRCLGLFFFLESGMEKLSIQTMAGNLECTRAGKNRVSINMGKIKTKWHEIPLSKNIDTLNLNISSGPLIDPVAVNVGNPHAVFFVDNLDNIDLKKHCSILQKNSIFPEHANIGVAQLIDFKTLRLSVWERPGMLTPACGTGACAAVAAAFRRGLISEKSITKCITVIMPAGNIEIKINKDNTFVMTGPAEFSYTGFLLPSE